MKTLVKDFNLRHKWMNNRASAVYPLDIKAKSDFVISFLNYWRIKNKLNRIILILSVFNEKGKKIKKKKIKIVKNHYNISISKDLNLTEFKGMVQIEFFSKQNIRYAFPAISGFYISPDEFISGVHSAGRILK